MMGVIVTFQPPPPPPPQYHRTVASPHPARLRPRLHCYYDLKQLLGMFPFITVYHRYSYHTTAKATTTIALYQRKKSIVIWNYDLICGTVHRF